MRNDCCQFKWLLAEDLLRNVLGVVLRMAGSEWNDVDAVETFKCWVALLTRHRQLFEKEDRVASEVRDREVSFGEKLTPAFTGSRVESTDKMSHTTKLMTSDRLEVKEGEIPNGAILRSDYSPLSNNWTLIAFVRKLPEESHVQTHGNHHCTVIA